MPRGEARVFTSIWTSDADFRALPPDGKTLYLFLVTQPELRWSGVIGFSPKLWARRIGWDEEQLRAAVKLAADGRFIVVDEDTEEVLVRSLIRRDDVWKQPKVLRIAVTDAEHTESAVIRAEIYRELLRLDPSQLSSATRSQVLGILADLPKRLVNALPDPPPEGPADPPVKGRHAGHVLGGGEPPADPRAEGGAEGPAKGVLEALPDPPADPPAEGDRGPRTRARPLPLPLPPPPPTRAHARSPARALALATAPANPKGEGDDSELKTRIAELTAEVRLIRADWSSSSIHRALAHPDVTERGWDRIRPAMLAVASDPDSQQPGRLSHDGPWWHPAEPAGPAPVPRPPWCGQCSDEIRRQVDTPAGIARCPTCHPLREAS